MSTNTTHTPRRPLEERKERPERRTWTRTHGPDTFGRVHLRLVEIAQARGYVNRDGRPNRAQLQRLTSIADDTLYYLLRHPELTDRIHLRTLAKLCKGLDCTPADLLEYIPHGGGESPLSDQYKTNPALGLE